MKNQIEKSNIKKLLTYVAAYNTIYATEQTAGLR